MKIHNFLECDMRSECIHEGIGESLNATVFEEHEMDAPVRFINYAVIPPAASIGLHPHGSDNEFYVLLEGEGIYQQDGEEVKVKKGDIMMNSPFSPHGIINTGKEEMKLLIFEAIVG